MIAVRKELAELGVEVRRACVAFKAKAADIIEGVKVAWILYSIAKEAKGKWPAIREVLRKAGLSRYEITTLGLSDYTRKPKQKKKP